MTHSAEKGLRDTQARTLLDHAECCVTGSGCTHDSESECADALLAHARDLLGTRPTPPVRGQA